MKSLLFKTEMVNAILNEDKTMTRRFARTKNPKYNKGEVIYVKETYNIDNNDKVIYKAVNPNLDIKWKSSMFMPEIYASIFLEITGSKKESLNDISEKDAIAEGIESEMFHGKQLYRIYDRKDQNDWTTNPVISFISLWESIHGEGSWAENPEVYVYSFKIKHVKKP